MPNYRPIFYDGTQFFMRSASGFVGVLTLATIAPANASYVVLGANGTLTNERILTAPAAGITLVDGGAGMPLTLTLANDLAALEGLGGTGIPYRSGADAWAMATISTGLTFSGGALTWDGLIARKNSGSDVGPRRRINFHEGSNITLTVADDAGNGEVDVTIAAAGSSGATLTRVAGSSGAAGSDITAQYLSSDSADNTSVTPAVVMTTTSLQPGLYRFSYNMIYQTAAITTGISFAVNFTGTYGQFTSRWDHVTTGVTAANGIGDGSVTAAQLIEGVAQRVPDTIGFATLGSDAVNQDIDAWMQGTIEVTVAGDLQLKMGTEVAGSAVRLRAGSNLILTKIA